MAAGLLFLVAVLLTLAGCQRQGQIDDFDVTQAAARYDAAEQFMMANIKKVERGRGWDTEAERADANCLRDNADMSEYCRLARRNGVVTLLLQRPNTTSEQWHRLAKKADEE